MPAGVAPVFLLTLVWGKPMTANDSDEHLVPNPNPDRQPASATCSPTAKGVKRFMRRCLAQAMPEIAKTLLTAAKAGKLPELKIAIELSGLHDKNITAKTPKRRGRTFEEILMDDWRKEPVDGSGIYAENN